MIGQTISHYRITGKLGEGGMGVVYEAEDTRLKRTVALKLLPPELTRDEDARARFIHEAQAASALDHPNICTIHEIDETEDGRIFICMACYEGDTLRGLVSSKPLELGRAIDITMHVAQGLDQARVAEVDDRTSVFWSPYGESIGYFCLCSAEEPRDLWLLTLFGLISSESIFQRSEGRRFHGNWRAANPDYRNNVAPEAVLPG